MGQIMDAECRICNFKTSFRYGGGRFDYETNNPVPAINVVTEKLESINYISEKDNSNYLFYTQDCLKGNNGDNNVYQNFELQLNQNNNYCPNCKSFTFDFQIHMFY